MSFKKPHGGVWSDWFQQATYTDPPKTDPWAWDNEQTLGELHFSNFDISNSYGGVDFKVTAYIPLNDDQQSRITKWLNTKQMEATKAGDAKLVKYYFDKYRKMTKSSYIENLVEISDLAVSSRRSVPAVRRLGEVSPIAHAKGVRTIAGTMIMILLKKDPLVSMYGPDIADQQDNSPYFVDRLPPFHIILTATNEYGHTISAGIFHITIVDFGTTISVSDMYSEFQYTFKALHMTPFVHEDVRQNLRKFVNMVGTNNTQTVSDLIAPIKNRYGVNLPGAGEDLWAWDNNWSIG